MDLATGILSDQIGSFIDMIQAMSKNKELIDFMVIRLGLLRNTLEVIKDTMRQEEIEECVNMIEKCISEWQKTFEKILKRGKLRKFWNSKSDKANIVTMTNQLDMCVQSLQLAQDSWFKSQLDETNKNFSSMVNQLEELQEAIVDDLYTVNDMPNEQALEFFRKFFVSDRLIPEKIFIAAFRLQVKQEGFRWDETFSGYIESIVNSSKGVMTTQLINEFFENNWTTQEQKHHTIESAKQWQEHWTQFGELYHKKCYLSFESLGVSGQNNLIINPTGIPNGKQERVVEFDSSTCGIIMDPNEPLQARILCRSSGYYLQQVARNKLTRIRIRPNEPIALQNGMSILIGTSVYINVEGMYSFRQTGVGPINLADTWRPVNCSDPNFVESVNMEQLPNLVSRFDSEEATEVASGFDTIPKILNISTQKEEERQLLPPIDPGQKFIEFPRLERPLKGFWIGRGKVGKIDLAFPEDESISRQHGIIYFETQNWYYKDLGSQNGSWLVVRSNMEDQYSQQVQLNTGDEVQIAPGYSFTVNIDH